MTRTAADALLDMLKSLDTLDGVQAKFTEEVTGVGGAAWAIECYADDVFFARQMARMVRPLIKAYDEKPADEWLKMVRRAHRENTAHLINNHGRHNSTSILQNGINQWESEAMSKFVNMVGYWLQEG